MLTLSIDIETTGIDNQKNQMIQFAAVIEDTAISRPISELPSLMCYIAHSNYNISSGLAHKEDDFHTLETIKKISDFQHSKEVQLPVYGGTGMKNSKGEIFTTSRDLSKLIARWLAENNYPKNEYGKYFITPAGKNVTSFDIPFIKATMTDWSQTFSFSQRALDPAILFFDHINDEMVPDLTECKRRAGIAGKVTHDALDDAIDVIELLRFHFNKKWQ